MSVASLISAHGVLVNVARPTETWQSNGAMSRTYTGVAALRAFIQPRAAADNESAGRANGVVSATFYFEGQADIDVDDVLQEISTGRLYWVKGVRVPILRPTASPNSHTVVDADYVPGETITITGEE